MANRSRPNRRAVKLHRSYTVEEASRVLGVAKGTVRRWLKIGLPAISDRKPILILGGDLSDFLEARARPRTKCGPAECYCFKCRQPRAAAAGIADFIPLTPKGGNLRALCDTCGTLMHRHVSGAQLKALQAVLDVSITEPSARIGERPSARLNDHFDKGARDHA